MLRDKIMPILRYNGNGDIKRLICQDNEDLTYMLNHLRVFNGYVKAAILLLVDNVCDKVPYPSPFIEDEKYEDALCDLISSLEQDSTEKEINMAADNLITIHKFIVWDFSKEILKKIENQSFDEYDILHVLGFFAFAYALTNSLNRIIRMDDKDIAALTKYHDTPTGRAINHALFSFADEIAEERMNGITLYVDMLNNL